MKKAVVLLSGGLDSTTCMGFAKSKGFDLCALSFQYGQKQSSELNAAKNIAERFKAFDHRIVDLSDLGKFGGSALTDDTIAIPGYDDSGEIPVTYVPARNTVFLSVALSYAEALGARDIFIGVSHVDYSGYPDCRPEYICAFQAMADLSSKCGVEGDPIKIHTPIIELSKAKTIELGLACGVDYSMTVTCYQADDQGRACGQCDSCVLRQKGFADAGVKDPTRYV